MRKKKTAKYFIGRFFRYAGLALFLIYTVFPLVWLFLSSIKSKKEMYNFPVEYWPDNPTLINYEEVIRKGSFLRYTWNSLFLALIVGGAVALLTCMSAYVLSRMNFKGKQGVFIFFMMTQMLPTSAGFASMYLLMSRLHMTDKLSTVALILIAGQIPFGTIMQIGFLKGIPTALEEAALIDGCGRFKMFLRIVLPLAKPGLFTVFIFTFLAGWNDTYTSVMYINSEKYKTLAVAIYSLIGVYDINWGNVAAGTMIAIVPAMILFACMKEVFVENIGGAVKE